MNRSASNRLHRLETWQHEQRRRADPQERRRRAEAAEAAGTASLKQYALVYADDVAWLREQLFDCTPLILAFEKTGRYPTSPACALAYPPDVEVPEHVSDQQFMFAKDASAPQRHTYMGGEYRPEGRRDAALLLLALGKHDGIAMRRRIWVQSDGDGWQLRPAVMEAAAHCGPSIKDAEEIAKRPRRPFGVPSQDDCIIWEEVCQDPCGGTPWISYAEVARSSPVTWCTTVDPSSLLFRP